MKLFKRLTALFVVMFAFVAVLAVANVKADDKVIYYDFSTFSGTSVQYEKETHQLTEDFSITIEKCHINQQLRIYSSATNNGIVTSGVFSSRIKSIKFNVGNKADTLNVYGSTDGSGWTLVGGVATTSSYADKTLDFGDTSYTYFKLDVAGSQQVRIKNITITLENDSTAPVLDTPTNVAANEETITWDEVANATGYKVGLYANSSDSIAKFEVSVDENTYTFDYLPYGTYYVKVTALGDEVNYQDSADSEALEVVCDKVYKLTVTEFYSIPSTWTGLVKCEVTGTISGFYTKNANTSAYEEVEENNYDSTYGNVSFYLTDGVSKVVCYRVTGDNAAVLAVGDTVTVTGNATYYGGKNQFPQGATFADLRKSSTVALGYQVSELDEEANTVSLRLLAGLNAEAANVTALSLVIDGANENAALDFTAVYDKITADTENGVTEITAEELGFAKLAALTITDVPTGASLTVTISYTTAEGTFSSVTKNYTVNADGTVVVA